MTYGDKLKEHSREIELMSKEDCKTAFAKTSWCMMGNDKERIFRGGMEYGLQLALKLAEEAKISDVVI